MPWREKHRPEWVTQLIGLETLKRDIKSWCASNTWPAGLLFAGPPGTGKTTVANIVGNEMNPNASRHSNFYENNASDDRGIGFIRDTIKPMAGIMPMSPAKRKIIFLDEADGLTKPAQDALKRLMEEHSHHTTFILAVKKIFLLGGLNHTTCFMPQHTVTYDRHSTSYNPQSRRKLLCINALWVCRVTAHNLHCHWLAVTTYLCERR